MGDTIWSTPTPWFLGDLLRTWLTSRRTAATWPWPVQTASPGDTTSGVTVSPGLGICFGGSSPAAGHTTPARLDHGPWSFQRCDQSHRLRPALQLVETVLCTARGSRRAPFSIFQLSAPRAASCLPCVSLRVFELDGRLRVTRACCRRVSLRIWFLGVEKK